MKRLYKYVALVAAKLVGRRHIRDIPLPGLKELRNAFVSRSDSAITQRPDFDPISESLAAISDNIEFRDGTNEDDYLNSSFGLLGSGRQIFLSSYGQFDNDGDSVTTVYQTGTASVSTGSVNVTGVGTSWNSEVWPGCTIEFAGNGTLYVIDEVISDTEIRLKDTSNTTHSASSYEVRLCHNSHNSNYKFNIQNFSNGVVYSCPTLDMPPSKRDISGPFYANVSTVTTSETDTYIFDGVPGLANDNVDLGPRSTAVLGTRGARLVIASAAVQPKLLQTSDITDPTAWELSSMPSDFLLPASGNPADILYGFVYHNSSYQYALVLAGKKESTGEAAIAYTVDYGSNWTIVPFTGTSAFATRLEWRAFGTGPRAWWVGTSDNEIIFTDDGFQTYSSCTGLSGMTGDITAIRHGRLAFDDDDLTGFTVPAGVISVIALTDEGEIYYAAAYTQTFTISELSEFTKKTDDLDGSGWVDCAYKPTYQDSTAPPPITSYSVDWYNWAFVRKDAAGTGEKPIYLLQTYTRIIVNNGTVYYSSGDINNTAYNLSYGYNNGTAQYNCIILNPCDEGANYFYVAGKLIDTDRAFVLREMSGNPSNNANNLFSVSEQTSDGGAVTVYKYGSCGNHQIVCSMLCPLEDGPYGIVIDYGADTTYTTTTSITPFTPISKTIRALTHSILDGYVVVMATYEYNSTTEKWEYHPRRIRWTAPLTYNDFEAIGSGTAELDGSGVILDSRRVNGRIVTFESSAIGAISPRGYFNDPWEYDKIKDNISAVSNPVVVDDVCYFIDDSGLLRQTNGVTVETPPFSFDLSEYDDFNADQPVWMTYSAEFEALGVFNPSDTNRYVYMIETESGSVSRFQLATVANGESDALSPKSIVCTENSSDRRMMACYNPIAADTSELVCAELSTGSTVTGLDEWTSESGDDTYHVVDVQTPEDYVVNEGVKTGIKHIIARTYCDGSTTATNPSLAVLIRSLEDTTWHSAGDATGTITVTTTACTGDGTAWSNVIGQAGVECDGANKAFTTPCLATQARIYNGSTLQTLGTDYTITDTKEVTFVTAPLVTDTVYAYWENEPYPGRVEVGDLIQTTEGWHRITAINSATSLTLDHYLSTGTDATATHVPAERIPNGDGEVKIGVSKLTEGVRLRFIIMADSSGDATVTKLTGYSIGHIPAGTKIVEV